MADNLKVQKSLSASAHSHNTSGENIDSSYAEDCSDKRVMEMKPIGKEVALQTRAAQCWPATTIIKQTIIRVFNINWLGLPLSSSTQGNIEHSNYSGIEYRYDSPINRLPPTSPCNPLINFGSIPENAFLPQHKEHLRPPQDNTNTELNDRVEILPAENRDSDILEERRLPEYELLREEIKAMKKPQLNMSPKVRFKSNLKQKKVISIKNHNARRSGNQKSTKRTTKNKDQSRSTNQVKMNKIKLPSTEFMMLDCLKHYKKRNGLSFENISEYICDKYDIEDLKHRKKHMKSFLEDGLKSGLVINIGFDGDDKFKLGKVSRKR